MTSLSIVQQFVQDQPGPSFSQRIAMSACTFDEISLMLRAAEQRLKAPETGRYIAGVDVLAAIIETYQGLTGKSSLDVDTGQWQSLDSLALPAAQQMAGYEYSCPAAIRFDEQHYPGSENEGALDDFLLNAIEVFERTGAVASA
jgi:hypothetical protein